MFAVGDDLPTEDWTDYTFILPAISVGNVGQLAVDLMLATFDVEHILYVNNETVLPAVGTDPFDLTTGDIVTSWQIYQCRDRKLIIMQQRSGVIEGQGRKYLTFLIDWIKEKNFKMVVMLSSCFAEYFTPDNLADIEMHYLMTPTAKDAIGNKLEDMHWREYDLGNLTEEKYRHALPGGGLSNSFHIGCEAHDVPLIIIIQVCWEGDNTPEAFRVANSCARLLFGTKETIQWTKPQSWCLPFGSPPNMQLY